MTAQELKRINQAMLDGMQDGTGYRPEDYPDVAVLSRLKVPYNWLEAYALLDTIRKYIGTSSILEPYKDELQKIYGSLQYQVTTNLTPAEATEEITKARVGKLGHSYTDFDPFFLRFFGHDDNYVYLGLREFISDIRPARFGGSWQKIDGKSCIAIANEQIGPFLDYIRTAGIVGHVAPNSLLNYIDELRAKQQPEKEEVKPVVTIYPTRKEKNSFGHDAYIITCHEKWLIDELWKAKDVAVKYVDAKKYDDKIVVYSTKMMLPSLMNICTLYGIEVVTNPETEQPVEEEPPAVLPPVSEELLPSGPEDADEKVEIDLASLNLPITPYPFQLEDAEKFLAKKRGLIGHEMGCGKTIIAILVGMHLDYPKIVVCPESLRLNWKREIERMQPDADVKIIYSKDKVVTPGKDWSVLGYKTCVKHKDALIKGKYVLIVDEAHNIKSVDNYGHPASARALAVMEMAEKAERLYLLTGTPMPTRSKDLYNMLVMLHEINPNEKYAFHRYGLEYCQAFHNNFGWNYNGTSNQAGLHQILRKYMIRRLKKDVLPHLRKQRQFIPIGEITNEYKKIEQDLVKVEPGLEYMGMAMKGRRLLSRVKVNPAIDLAENYLNSEESIVIVTEFTETLQKIASHFGDNACTICGDMTDKAKQQAIDDFQSGRKKVCVINLIAGGVGVTLTKAHNMIVCDYDWTPSNMVQVEDRICRSGQLECCNIYYLYCEKALLDRAFISMITHKSENIDRVVDNSENTNDFEKSKNENMLYYEYLVKQIKKEQKEAKAAKRKAEKSQSHSAPRQKAVEE